MNRLFSTALCCVGISAVVMAAEGPEKDRASSKSAELRQLDQEAAWQFEPIVGRPDPFFDREAVLRVELELRKAQEQEAQQAAQSANPSADLLAFAKDQQARIESLVVAKKYEEAIRIADTTLKILEKSADQPDIQAAMTRISTYRDQADDALTRNEAQAQFDALALKVDGILWSESGSRLVIIGGEPKAYGINERVKDCVIINIDTDRVDFRFHYKRKRFEFPRYVGEDARNLAQQANK